MEQKRFKKVYLDPKDYEGIERAARLTRNIFPWVVLIVVVFLIKGLV
jgi:hypothetical protein